MGLIVNKKCMIKDGRLKGLSGTITAYDYLKNEVTIQIDKFTQVITISEMVTQ